MDFDAIIQRDCPTPIEWEASRRYMVRRVNDHVRTIEADLADERDTRKVATEAAANAISWLTSALTAARDRIEELEAKADEAWHEGYNVGYTNNNIRGNNEC